MILKFLNKITLSFIIFLIKLYKLFFSFFLKSNCRYLPTCSEYAIIAFKKHGLIFGFFYSIKRILSCHPFGGQGYDTVPTKQNKDT